MLLMALAGPGIALAGKGGSPARIPRKAAIAMLQFQDALEQEEWTKALTFCSEEVTTASQQWGSPRDFFRKTVPIDTVLTLRTFPYHSCRTANGTRSYDLYIRLTEPNFVPVILWDCSLQEADGEWRIRFSPEPVDLEEAIRKRKAQVAARKNELEQLRKALEPELRGVKTHLTAVSDEFVVGKPMVFRLELMNYGAHTLLYDDQQVAVNASMVILNEDKRRVPYIGGSYQTCGGWKVLKPNSTVVLCKHLDINGQYAIGRPGVYWVQFRGEPLSIGKKLSPDDPNDPFSNVISTTTQFPSNIIRIDAIKEPR